MLPVYSTFLLKHGVRNYLQLMNPKVAPIEDIVLPKGTTFHYIDFDNEVMFPTAGDMFLHGVPTAKKVPIYHVPTLESKLGNPLVIDKQTPRKIRKWFLANMKRFRNVPLLEVPTSENLTVPIVNYNVIKHMYRYTNSLMSRHYRTFNMFSTIYSSMKKVIELDKKNIQIMEMTLPSSLPSFAVMKRLSLLPVIKQSRIVTNTHMRQVLDLFTWLDSSIRSKTALDVFKETDSSSVLMMFKYKGEVVFLPFDIIVSLLNSNEMPSKAKLSVDQVQKIFMRFLRVVQKKIESPEDVILDESDNMEESAIAISNPIQDVSDDEDEDQPDPNFRPSKERLTEADNRDKQFNSVRENDKVQSLMVNGGPEAVINELLKDDVEDNTIDISYMTDITHAESVTDVDTDEVEEDNSLKIEDFTSTDEEVHSILNEGTTQEKNAKEFQALVASKLVSSSEISAHKKMIAARAVMISPYEKDANIDAYKQVSEKEIEIKTTDRELPVNNDFIDDSIKSSSLNKMDKNYIKNVLPKDVIACVTHIEKSGLTIKEYTIEPSSTVMGNYETHRIVVKPLKGPESPLYFRLPKVNSEGNFTAAGIKYKMKKQRADIPIRKISHNEVKLSSYYGKLFVATTERKAYDTLSYVNDYIKDLYFHSDTKQSVLKKVVLGNVYKNSYKVPTILQSLSKAFSSLTINSDTYLFDQSALAEFLDPAIIKDMQEHGLFFCGYNSNKKPIVCDFTDTFHIYDKKGEITPIGSIETLLQMDLKKIPVSYTDVKILGKNLPLGVIIAYYLGFKNLVKILKPTMKLMENGKRYELEAGEWALRFSDYKLIFNRKEKENTLILAGFNFFKDFIKGYNLEDFDNKNIYMNMVEERDFGMWHLKELDILKDLFLDPITIDQLKLMKEPTEFIPLLMRANSMLTDFSYPDINDTRYSRIKGYERVPGIVYKTLAETVRNYKFKNTVKNKLELNPYDVWNNITQDTSVKIVEDINPVMNLKEMEAVTLGGSDGIGKDMVASKLREYNRHDMGMFSEASGDGSDVAINTFLSPDAKFSNIRGNYDENNKDFITDPKKLLSTSSMLAVGTNNDD